jgi:homoserine O-acetyltransferase/O-succinyltransferase
MGGMNVLEWAFFGPEYVRSIVPMATSARHSAWCISWGEAQRQSIYADPKYLDGYYPPDDPPLSGLAAARMSALLTYRSRNSFESRFGRKVPDPLRNPYPERAPPQSPSEEHWVIHNDGHRLRSEHPAASRSRKTSQTTPPESMSNSLVLETDGTSSPTPLFPRKVAQHHFSAQSYLRYQGNKFVKRFDPNCYISITRKLDTHDIARSRFPSIKDALASLPQPALVLGIESDGLFTFAEQEEIAEGLPNGRLEKISSPEGHDGFLLEFDQVNRHILGFMRMVLPEIMDAETTIDKVQLKVVKSSMFGEAEVEVNSPAQADVRISLLGSMAVWYLDYYIHPRQYQGLLFWGTTHFTISRKTGFRYCRYIQYIAFMGLTIFANSLGEWFQTPRLACLSFSKQR